MLPEPAVGTSAPNGGITGAPVSFWAGGIPQGDLAFGPTVLDGRHVETTARAISFEWDTGDSGTAAPRSRYVTQAPGTAEQPAVTHVYETKSSVGRPAEGFYTIRLTVRWERRYRVAGTVDPCNEWCLLDPGETDTTMPYRVAEVRSVLVDQIGGQG